MVAGQGTLGLEILDQCPELDVLFVAVGGGGLVSGVAASIKSATARRARAVDIHARGGFGCVCACVRVRTLLLPMKVAAR